MNRVSTFFTNFSLQELVKNKLYLPTSYPNRSSRGAGGGHLGHGQFLYRRSESFPCPIYVSDYVSFDEQGFITSLKAEVEKEIIDSAATISRQGNIEGNFNSSEFYFEYTQDGIKGRIVISGKMIKSSYYLTADLEEIAEGDEFPFAAEEFSGARASVISAATGGGVFPFAITEFGRVKPEGDFYVVAFRQGDPLAQVDKLHNLGVELMRGWEKRIPRSLTNEPDKDIKYAEVWSLVNIPQHLRQLLRERGIEQNVDMPDEYKEYEKVYFLNEVALQMYRDGGIELDALKKVSGSDMPKRCNRTLRVPYIPQ